MNREQDHSTPIFPIDKITIGDRHRKNLGDIKALADNIASIGLLHPIAVTPAGELIAGRRRLEAAKLLGWSEIPVHLVDLEHILLGESAENFYRKTLTPSEQVAIADAVEKLERERAKERQREHGGTAPGKKKNTGGKLPPVIGKTRDRVAKAIGGMSGRSLEKVRVVVQAAEERPELAHIVETMDRTGNVDGAFKKVRIEHVKELSKKEAGAAGVELLHQLEDGAGKYRCLYADPPWRYDDSGCSGAAEDHYSTMSIEEMAKLPVGQLAHPDGAHLWMWTTMPMNRDHAPHRVLEAWGFRWVGEILWIKPSIGPGRWIRSTVEMVILGVKGTMPLLRNDQPGHVEAPRGKHSEKPAEFYSLIESLTPGPRIELFARKAREGWTRWGLEAPAADSSKTKPEPEKKLATLPSNRRGEESSTRDTSEIEAGEVSQRERDDRFFVSMIEDIQKSKEWRKLGLKSFQEYCEKQLYTTADKVMAIVARVKKKAAAAEEVRK